MFKRIIIALLLIGLVGGGLVGIKALQIKRMVAQGEQYAPQPAVVTAASVRAESWDTVLDAVGTVTAVQGVTVAAQLPGKVTSIDFESGKVVRAGQLLVRQDTSSEEAELRAAEAQADLARVDLERMRGLREQGIISQSEYDQAEATSKEATARVDTIRSSIDKKTIRAPFAGRVGIRLVNLGQVLDAGAPVVTLQSLDPIHVDFALPQQDLRLLEEGLPVRVVSDSLPGEKLSGTLTAINPLVEETTRSVQLQATLDNPEGLLRPGAFVSIEVVLPAREQILAIPATAVLYAPYSDSVFVIEPRADSNATGTGQASENLVVRQQFVSLGRRQGDFVTVESGVEPGESVVSTGVFKLRNGQAVTVDNALQPEFRLNPEPEES